MPGPYIPPAVPLHPGRRQSDYHYHPPPQTQPPVAHNPYAAYHHPPYYGPPHAPQYPQPWYPPYQQHQYPVMPRPYHQQQPQTPIIVSSHPHAQPVTPVTRPMVSTPPIPAPPHPQAQSQILQAPPTPPVNPQTQASPATPTTSMSASPPQPSSSRPSFSAPPSQPQSSRRMPFYPQLPWLSVPSAPFPPKASPQRRRRKELQSSGESLELPVREERQDEQSTEERDESQSSTIAGPSDLETPATSQAPSEADSTHPTTPSSALPPASTTRAPAPSAHTRTATIPAIPLLPVRPSATTSTTPKSKEQGAVASPSAEKDVTAASVKEASSSTNTQDAESTAPTMEDTPKPASPVQKVPPKSWADLFGKGSTASTAAASTLPNGTAVTDNFGTNKTGSLTEVLSSYTVDSNNKFSFLEPRGLVNTGNMCYMNSILQTLVFCIPFYDFLDQVGKRAAHSFKSETPLIDAMIMFMREFHIIDSAVSTEQLRLRLKDNELEQYGDPVTPEYVYDVIKRLPRFSSMRRGHQQDAEEFLGFLLEGLHDECVQVLKALSSEAGGRVASPSSDRTAGGEGWFEVGHKQKAAVTQSSGTIEIDSPITKIFGGKLRSELRVPSKKNSVTLEPYQPLQLDIGSPDVHNITDALKGLTRSETLQGNFNTARGPGTSATKQVFIETLPPVLILHLKRFQYDNTGGTQKIWKKVGYPLELTVPKEVFPPSKRSALSAQRAGGGGPPKYRLIGVVYHHGKNASGGHYTVDVRRQDGREWIRMDDTVIQRVRSEDVAEGGSEEDPRVLAAALENHKRDRGGGRNIFEQAPGLDEDEEGEREREEEEAGGGWSQVNGSAAAAGTPGGGGARKWSSVANGSATPSTAGKRTPRERSGLKDNKVAYILFYQQIKS